MRRRDTADGRRVCTWPVQNGSGSEHPRRGTVGDALAVVDVVVVAAAVRQTQA